MLGQRAVFPGYHDMLMLIKFFEATGLDAGNISVKYKNLLDGKVIYGLSSKDNGMFEVILVHDADTTMAQINIALDNNIEINSREETA